MDANTPAKKKVKTEGNFMSMESCIPWDQVFGFMGGADVGRALMTSKDCSPWKFSTSTCGSDKRWITRHLMDRLEAEKDGRNLLKLHNYPRDDPILLSKLLNILESKKDIRYDGVYRRNLIYINSSYRFFPGDKVVSANGCYKVETRYNQGKYFDEGLSENGDRMLRMETAFFKFGQMMPIHSLMAKVRASDGVLNIENSEYDDYEFVPFEPETSSTDNIEY